MPSLSESIFEEEDPSATSNKPYGLAPVLGILKTRISTKLTLSH
jgi:hypothetical protein